ncbi:MAG: 6-bladed beta-propeller [Balneola sp.]
MLLWLVLFAISCGKTNDTQLVVSAALPVFSVDSLEIVIPELPTDSILAFETQKIIAPYDLVQTKDEKFWVSADRLEHQIILFDQLGSYLAETGRKGKGPGEFEGATILHIGWDNDLYVLDSRLQRITQYELSENQLNMVSSFSPSSSSELSTYYREIYVTEWGNFGVICTLIDYKTGEEEYSLVELDEEFKVKKRLLTMPGNEKMSLDRWNHVNHLAGKKTFWDLNGEWFYHVSSHNTVINKYNVRTGKSTSLSHLLFEDRRLTEEIRLELLDVAYNMTERSDKIHEAFVDVEVLPLFQDFMVYENHYYLVIYNPSGSESTELIRVNEISGKIEFADIPLSLWKVKAGKQMIYGTVTSGEDAQIRVIKFTD